MALHISFVLYLFFFGELILSKRLTTPDSNALKTDKLNECQRCKILTDSFYYWMEKTSRGKYEGGDAAWEEAKLKSYARSEIRLVEVQEGLCSELKRHQDHCYILSEEAEQVLEKWWFNEEPNAIDLHTWLCIETLQYCCPTNHYGDTCSPCPLDKNNNVCGGHGKCDGEGTRKGNGTCICKRGYGGKYCDECSKNYYFEDTMCLPCHKACNDCSGEGATACNLCKMGWELQSGTCVDIDECKTASICEQSQYCINKEGSYSCKACDATCKTCNGEGPANCISCEPSFILWSGMCLDGKQKSDILFNVLRRTVLYIGMFIITLLLFRSRRAFASLIVLILAMYVYFSEKISKENLVDVFLLFIY